MTGSIEFSNVQITKALHEASNMSEGCWTPARHVPSATPRSAPSSFLDRLLDKALYFLCYPLGLTSCRPTSTTPLPRGCYP